MTDLILYNDKALQQYLHQLHPRIKTANPFKASVDVHAGAYNKGFEAGKGLKLDSKLKDSPTKKETKRLS